MSTILIVEDNVLNTTLVEEILSNAGYTVLLAEDAEQALPLAHTHHPEVVLMDIRLPGMSGVTALQHLRNDPQTCAAKVIAVTANALVGERERLIAAGFDGYVAKPFKMRALLDAIEAALST